MYSEIAFYSQSCKYVNIVYAVVSQGIHSALHCRDSFSSFIYIIMNIMYKMQDATA